MRFDWSEYEAVLFDLDGVLTSTAALHAAAWKRTFDAVLRELKGPDEEPFDIDADYRTYVDGRPRYDGVAAFLRLGGSNCRGATPATSPGSTRSVPSATARTAVQRRPRRAGRCSQLSGLLDHLEGVGRPMWSCLLRRTPVQCWKRRGYATGSRWWSTGSSPPRRAGRETPPTFLEAARR